jgi:AcrR family transcriptional regulator
MGNQYHHGNLRAVLLQAAEEVLAEKGVDRFSLRETARRAGVSPGAPKHHFPNVRALFTAIATGAFDDLALRLEQASADASLDHDTRVRQQGIAYVEFALEQQARFDLMWRTALLNTDDPEHKRASTRAFMALDTLIRGEDMAPRPKNDPVTAPTIACWSLVHGFARLAIDGAFGTDRQAIRRAITALLPAVLARIST